LTNQNRAESWGIILAIKTSQMVNILLVIMLKSSFTIKTRVGYIFHSTKRETNQLLSPTLGLAILVENTL
jgi:hypothetical protein